MTVLSEVRLRFNLNSNESIGEPIKVNLKDFMRKIKQSIKDKEKLVDQQDVVDQMENQEMLKEYNRTLNKNDFKDNVTMDKNREDEEEIEVDG